MSKVVRRCDVVVVGGGAAALCAAISARRSGASVLLLECAPKALRGGNARHSRNFRIMHDGPTPFIQGRYSADDYRSDLLRVTGGRMDDAVADRLIGDSAGIVDWLMENGVRFQAADDGNLPYSRKTAFFLGGGKALVNALYGTAARRGVDVRYDSEVCRLDPGDGRRPSVTVCHRDGEQVLSVGAVVAASGGFQANRDWLRELWGAVADQIVTRGTPHATGTVLKGLLDRGAAPVGDVGYGHMVAVDARSPRFDGGIVTRLDGLAQGIVVDRQGRRFADEGSDIGPTRFSVWGDRVARCPGGVAFAIFDSAIERRFHPSIFPTIRAGSIRELAVALGIAPEALERTIRDYNAAVRSGGGSPSGGRTEGLDPPKSRQASPIAAPPFGAYPVRAGLTSTQLGVRVDERARVLDRDGAPMDGIFAAGVIMAPNVMGRGYLAGIAMTIGAVFGRIAGREAAAHALR